MISKKWGWNTVGGDFWFCVSFHAVAVFVWITVFHQGYSLLCEVTGFEGLQFFM